MHVQINAPHAPSRELLEKAEAHVTEALALHAEKLTRVEVHLRDLNAQKGGVDQRCVVEARPRGLDPVSAEHQDSTPFDALRGAVKKLDKVLSHRFGKLAARQRPS